MQGAAQKGSSDRTARELKPPLFFSKVTRLKINHCGNLALESELRGPAANLPCPAI